MKKKLLSLVMVLAMALSLLPTAVFAEAVANAPTVTFEVGEITQSGGKVTVPWTAKATDSSNAAISNPTWTDYFGSAGKVSVTLTGGTANLNLSAQCAPGDSGQAELTVPAGTAEQTGCTVTVTATPAKDQTETEKDVCTVVDGTKSNVTVSAVAAADKAFTDITVTGPQTNPTAGGGVTFTISSAKAGGSTATSDELAKLEVTGASWTMSGASSPDSTGNKTTAPSTAGPYSVEVTVGLVANTTGYSLADDQKTKTVSVTVADAVTTPGTAGTITLNPDRKVTFDYTPAADEQSAPTISGNYIEKGSTGSTTSLTFTAGALSNNKYTYTSAEALPANTDAADKTYTVTLTKSGASNPLKTGDVTVAGTGSSGGSTVSINSANFSNSTTLNVSWTYSAIAAVRTDPTFDVIVEGHGTSYAQQKATNVGTLANGVYSYTMTLNTPLVTGKYDVFVGGPTNGSANAYTYSDTTEVSFTESEHTPPTSTDTIPDAGNVTNSAAAESAIKNIQNSDADKIAEDVGKELTDTSSSASTATIDKLEALDQAVQDKAGITVAVSPDSKAPDALNTKKVSIVGAALNAEKTSNTKIELQISSPKTERTLGRTYDNDVAVQFSMTLTNVVSTKKLAVPVIISLPLPSGISSSRAVVLHYAGTDSASQVLPSKVSGGYISFVVTGFSDFIITQRAEKKTSTSGGGGGYSKVTNIPVTVTPNTPSTPAGIFTDVPANHSFASQITWARDNGVMGGYSDGSFRPTNPTNRQQLWMVLARLSGASPADMAAAREWAVNAGVSDGTNGEGTLSRQQLVTMLYRYAQSQEMNLEGAADLSTYPDNGAVASYAGEALAWAVGKGIVTGTSDGRLNPEGTATRGQFAVMMYRFSHQG